MNFTTFAQRVIDITPGRLSRVVVELWSDDRTSWGAYVAADGAGPAIVTEAPTPEEALARLRVRLHPDPTPNVVDVESRSEAAQ